MKKWYIVERNFDISIYEEEIDAVMRAADEWEMLTESEKNKCKYFMVYEIETDKNPDDIADLLDYETRMIKDYLEENKQ